MGRAIARCIACLVPVAVLVAASAASAAYFVDFESDTPFINLANGFTSSGSTQIHFSDTDGVDLMVVQAFGSQGLALLGDDDSGLLMEFDFVASALSLDLGNSSLANLGDTAVLTLFLGGSEVGSTSVALNLTDPIDQTISYAGVSFDSAILRYDVAGGLTEFVDNIQVVPAIPEPSAGFVFGIGVLLVGAACRRRSSAELEQDEMRD
ncbi:MAG: hypothetical protein JRF15_16125 [Deltaproteobacteria bacterium]|jgi:hypothetical protein|nr:hypothetical protein [Deltaproteobacteria bacterium]